MSMIEKIMKNGTKDLQEICRKILATTANIESKSLLVGKEPVIINETKYFELSIREDSNIETVYVKIGDNNSNINLSNCNILIPTQLDEDASYKHIILVNREKDVSIPIVMPINQIVNISDKKLPVTEKYALVIEIQELEKDVQIVADYSEQATWYPRISFETVEDLRITKISSYLVINPEDKILLEEKSFHDDDVIGIESYKKLIRENIDTIYSIYSSKPNALILTNAAIFRIKQLLPNLVLEAVNATGTEVVLDSYTYTLEDLIYQPLMVVNDYTNILYNNITLNSNLEYEAMDFTGFYLLEKLYGFYRYVMNVDTFDDFANMVNVLNGIEAEICELPNKNILRDSLLHFNGKIINVKDTLLNKNKNILEKFDSLEGKPQGVECPYQNLFR